MRRITLVGLLPVLLIAGTVILVNHALRADDGMSSAQYGTIGFDTVCGIAVGASNSEIVVGETDGQLFGKHAGGADVFVTKRAGDGSAVWSIQFGSSAGESPDAVAVDPHQNFYVVGNTSGDLYAPDSGEVDVFLAKFGPTGQLVWGKQLGTDQQDIGQGVALDSESNIYVCGETSGSLFSHNASLGTPDLFVAKFDSSGNRVWGKQLGDEGVDMATSIVATPVGGIYVVGQTQDLFGSTPGSPVAFICKLTADGDVAWGARFDPGSPRTAIARAVAVDQSGYVYIAGDTVIDSGTTDDRPVQHGFLAKYDASGNILWSKSIATDGMDSVTGIAVDGSSSLAVAGWTTAALPGNTNSGGTDGFVVWYSTASGDVIRTRQFGTGADDTVRCVRADSNSVIVGGSTSGALGGQNAGAEDAFITRLVPQ